MSPLWSGLVSVLAAAAVHTARAQTLTAELDYGTFQGSYSAEYNISYWQKIPFAAPPVGNNRFRGPQPPVSVGDGIYNSTQPFDMCPQQTTSGSEDCLYLGLWSRPWTKGEPLRPVLVNFYGGGFIIGGGSFSIPPGVYPVLNVSDTADFVIVNPNYRINAFGFLPGKEIAEDPSSDLNPGLLDQEMALEWTRQNIEQFGGDPNEVSIWGQSAGGGSVVAQVIAQEQGGRSQPLFNRALASSPFWPKTYRYDDPEAQALYDTLAEKVGCSGSGSLACLKKADLQALRTAALSLSLSQTYTTQAYTWAPVIDDAFLPLPLTAATDKTGGTGVNIEIGWGMFNTHEGESFIPPGLQNETDTGTPPFNSSTASFDAWLSGYLPRLSAFDMVELRKFYPPVGSSEGIPYYDDTFTRAGLIYRDSVLACPAYWIASAAPKAGYLGEYSIPPATHGADAKWWASIDSFQQSDPLIYDGFTGAFASFFATGDPNAHKLTPQNVPGVSELGNIPTRKEFNILTDSFADINIPMLEMRCAFWKAVAANVPM